MWIKSDDGHTYLRSDAVVRWVSSVIGGSGGVAGKYRIAAFTDTTSIFVPGVYDTQAEADAAIQQLVHGVDITTI